MKFQLVVRFNNFLRIRFCELKASGKHHLKKCYSDTAISLLQDVLNEAFTLKTNRQRSSTEENHHPSFLRFWNWAEENCRCSKICGGAENVVKTRAANIRMIARFHSLNVILRWKRSVINNMQEKPIDMGNSIYRCSLIYFWVPSMLLLHSDKPLPTAQRDNNAVQRCLPVRGRLHYPRRRRWWRSRMTDRLLLMCNRRRPAATSSRRASFSALASANSFVYFASSAATSR